MDFGGIAAAARNSWTELISHLQDSKSAAVALLKVLSAVFTIMALTMAWKSETNCSSSSLRLASDGYDRFVPKHNQAVHRGNATVALLLLVPASWLKANREAVIVTGVAWFMLNEAVIHLAAIRCHGSDQGAVGPAIFAAYAAVVFAVWGLFSQFE